MEKTISIKQKQNMNNLYILLGMIGSLCLIYISLFFIINQYLEFSIDNQLFNYIYLSGSLCIFSFVASIWCKIKTF